MVRPYGSLTLKSAKGAPVVGSIHKVGAIAQGQEACNGWDYWHVEDRKGLKSIDALRAVVRARDGGRFNSVMPGFMPGIHAFLCRSIVKAWMAGTSPAMTN